MLVHHERPLIIMDGCKKCWEINTLSLTCGFLPVLPWNNDTIIEKMDEWKWCHHETNFFQYMHAWNQDGVIIIVRISSLQFLLSKNTVNLKEWVAAITLLLQKKGNSSNGWLQLHFWINLIPMKKGWLQLLV